MTYPPNGIIYSKGNRKECTKNNSMATPQNVLSGKNQILERCTLNLKIRTTKYVIEA
jgi:hypothetical protein